MSGKKMKELRKAFKEVGIDPKVERAQYRQMKKRRKEFEKK